MLRGLVKKVNKLFTLKLKIWNPYFLIRSKKDGNLPYYKLLWIVSFLVMILYEYPSSFQRFCLLGVLSSFSFRATCKHFLAFYISFTSITNSHKGVFRIRLNIYDGTFLWNALQWLKVDTYFAERSITDFWQGPKCTPQLHRQKQLFMFGNVTYKSFSDEWEASKKFTFNPFLPKVPFCSS